MQTLIWTWTLLPLRRTPKRGGPFTSKAEAMRAAVAAFFELARSMAPELAASTLEDLDLEWETDEGRTNAWFVRSTQFECVVLVWGEVRED